MRDGGRVFRLDIKWRAMLLTSFLLLALTSLIVWVSNHALMNQFEHGRQAFYERQRQEILFSLQRSTDVMRQLASLAASSASLKQALLAENQASAQEALSDLWPTLQLDAGIEDIAIYDRTADPLVTLGRRAEGGTLQSVDKAWLNRVLNREEPADLLYCRISCQQTVAVPVLAKGVDAGIVVVSRSLADVTRYIRDSSGSEVALLVDSNGTPDGRYLSRWEASLVALTHESTLLPFIQSLARRFPFDDAQDRILSYSVDGQDYEISAISLPEAGGYGAKSGYFLLVSDVSSQLDQIDSTTRAILMISLGGWLAAEILLYLILRYRMGRLREISRKLPLLAARQYDVMRSSILPRKTLFIDEVDTLERTAVELEVKLEGLEWEVGERGKELEARIKELSRERDFISGLMNTAQVLVLTHRPGGKITLANHFSQLVTGKNENALRKMSFGDVFTDALFDAKTFLVAGGQQESRFVSTDGVTRTIVWYHTPLKVDEQHLELISVGVDITERKLAEDRLAWLANRDPLTELYNRRFFEEALQRAVVSGMRGALLYLDLDRFKDVNELSGHQSGDQLLRGVASALVKVNRGSVVARLGGDEFAILMEYASPEEAVARAKDIVALLEQQSLHVDGRTHRASGSIGIALYPENGDCPEDLMANADYAMYRAKDNASERWHLLLPDQQGREELKQRVFWSEKIRSALLHDQFELFLQPICRLADLKIQHYEALLRLKGENGSHFSPGTFIPIAERSGQIVAIDRWVIAKGIELLSQLADRTISIALNLSGQSLHDKGLMPFIGSELARREVGPERLIVEVTETAAVTDFTSARGVLEDIRNLGCQIALDDFGVGFSSFYYLGQLPSDYIKIDGSFITTLTESEENKLIVKAIADIARGLGKKTVAEFVDKDSTLSCLKTYNIDYVQGFYLGRPVPASEVGLK